MSLGETSTRKKILIGTSSLAVVALLIGGWIWKRNPSPNAPTDEVVRFAASEQFGKLSAEEKNKYLDKVPPVRLVDNSMSEDERLRLRMNLAAKYRNEMLDEYFKLSAKEKKAYLDKQIDEQQAIQKLLDSPTTQPGDKPKAMVRKFGGGSADQKKVAENIPPADRARMAEYMADMNARRAERGLPANGGMMMIRSSK